MLTDQISLEITVKDVAALTACHDRIARGTPVSVTALPHDTGPDCVLAAKVIKELALKPIPHFAARRLRNMTELETYIKGSVADADTKACFIIAGDPAQPEGPFSDSLSLIRTGVFEASGMEAIGVAGHPEGHPNMATEQCFAVIEDKCEEIEKRGMKPYIVTQFAFDAEPLIGWLEHLRNRGIQAPVRFGIPGPAGIKTLLRFAARCGVGASASVLAKYGISLTRLMGSAGPDKLVDTLVERIGPEHGEVRLHLYPFGGVDRAVDWMKGYRDRFQR